eukprot:m.149525 g.149525  ORF g.149525 m.149525 type:complete len:265 (+) comp30663_c0_seq1:124-918(+)
MDIKIEAREEGVEWVTINNEASLNSMTQSMLAQFNEYFIKLKSRPDVRIVVLRGAGERAFSVGLDLPETMKRKADEEGTAASPTAMTAKVLEVQRTWSDTVRNMQACPQPIICCINGFACGGGFAICLGTDIRLATKKAKFNVAMVKIGLTGCDIGISYFLPRAIGMANAAEMMYTGRMVKSEKALRMGLVNDVFDNISEMEDAAQELVDEMLETNSLGLQLTKQGLRLNMDAPNLEAALALEDRQQTLLVQVSMYNPLEKSKL